MITWLLIIINVVVYLVVAYLSGDLLEINDIYIRELGISKISLLQGNYWQILTSIFIHFNLPHLGYNMIFLMIFGLRGEEIYGKKFLLIYFGSGFFAELVSFIYPPATISGGASGAIFGILGANLIALRNLYSKGIWTSVVYGLVFFILAMSESTGFLAHLAGLIFGFTVGYWITRDWYEAEEDVSLDKEALEALEREMLKGL